MNPTVNAETFCGTVPVAHQGERELCDFYDDSWYIYILCGIHGTYLWHVMVSSPGQASWHRAALEKVLVLRIFSELFKKGSRVNFGRQIDPKKSVHELSMNDPLAIF